MKRVCRRHLLNVHVLCMMLLDEIYALFFCRHGHKRIACNNAQTEASMCCSLLLILESLSLLEENVKVLIGLSVLLPVRIFRGMCAVRGEQQWWAWNSEQCYGSVVSVSALLC